MPDKHLTEIERQIKLDRARLAQSLALERWAKTPRKDRDDTAAHMRSFKLVNKTKLTKKQTKPTTAINRATDKRESTEHGNRAIGQGCYKCIKQDCARCSCYCHSA